MYTHGIPSEFPLQLAYGFKKRGTFDVSDRTTYFGNYKVISARFTEKFYIALDFVCNVRNDLYCLAQIVSSALLVNDRFIDTACGH